MTFSLEATTVPTRIPDDARQRLEGLVQQTPAWRPWLDMLAETLRAIPDPTWDAGALEPDPERPAGTVLLDGALLTVPPRLAHDWLRRLLAVAAEGGCRDAGALAAASRADRLDALGLFEAAVCLDEPRLAALATTAGVDPQALAAIVHLAVLPLLQACGRRFAGCLPPTWPHGYCPVCGAWPVVTESRGLERARCLRCARCGGDWGIAWLHCPYCHTTDHEQLGSLVSETHGETRKVDTCAACKAYIKVVTTLRPWPAHMVLLEDLDTVDLDVAALEHGYARPQYPGRVLTTRLVEAVAPQRSILKWRLGKK